MIINYYIVIIACIIVVAIPIGMALWLEYDIRRCQRQKQNDFIPIQILPLPEPEETYKPFKQEVSIDKITKHLKLLDENGRVIPEQEETSMKIEYAEQEGIKFSNLMNAETFTNKNDDSIYFKTESALLNGAMVNAVDLKTGSLAKFDPDNIIYPINSKLTIYQSGGGIA